MEEKHYITRSNWLRAAVLGANDGILSTASIIVGVAAASTSTEPVVLAATAGLVAGAFSMAAGEYVSVSSQMDIEKADLEREQRELQTMPDYELKELAKIYEKRGVSPETAMQVAKEMTAHDALDAHARDELGIMETTSANPLQAAFASGLSFTVGGLMPVIVAVVAPLQNMIALQYTFAIIFLALLGMLSAYTGGAPMGRAVLRITLWGTLAMGASALVGTLFGTNVV